MVAFYVLYCCFIWGTDSTNVINSSLGTVISDSTVQYAAQGFQLIIDQWPCCVWQQIPVTGQMNVGDYCAAPYVDRSSIGYYRAQIVNRRNQQVKVGLSALLLCTVDILMPLSSYRWGRMRYVFWLLHSLTGLPSTSSCLCFHALQQRHVCMPWIAVTVLGICQPFPSVHLLMVIVTLLTTTTTTTITPVIWI